VIAMNRQKACVPACHVPTRLTRGRWLAALLGALLAGTCAAAPSISQFSPAFGAPGTVVTILGSGFADATEVIFGGAAASFATLSPGRLTALVPPDAVSGPITVNTASGTDSTAVEFTVAPRITEFLPLFGSAGDSIRLLGANFIPGGTRVKFGGVEAQVDVTASSQIQAVVPAGAQNGPLTVTTFAGTGTSATRFIVAPPGPVILGFEPASGRPGDIIVITGVKLSGASAVRFNGVMALFTATADTQVLATVPANATTGPISVVTPLGTASSDLHFQITSSAPTILDFTPTRGRVGEVVTIVGRNFSGATAVAFGGVNATVFDITADTQIQATVPKGAKTGAITVSRGTVTGNSAGAFTVSEAPSIAGFEPARAQVGATVILSGAHFTGATAVKFGSKPALFSVTADTQIQATVPAGATNAPISIATPGGTATTASDFVVLPPGPVITGFEPLRGAPGTLVLIAGEHLTDATVLRFGGVAAGFEATSDAQIKATVPGGAISGPISVGAPGGTNVSLAVFLVAPRIESFAPGVGGPGTSVAIIGANFTGATTVTFNGTPAAFTVLAADRITATVPPGAATGPLTVTTLVGATVSQVEFVVPPSITSFSPLAGPPGTIVEIVGSGLARAIAVLFGGTAAAFTVNSAASITAVVPVGAHTGPIIVSTPQGLAGSTLPFTVAVSGDLALSITAGPLPALAGNPVTYVLQVTNQGPLVVSDLLLTNLLPSGMTVVSLASSQGDIRVTSGRVEAALGFLAAGASAQCVVVGLPAGTGLITNIASVAAKELDPALADNSATNVTLVQDLFAGNLLRNPDAESGPGAASGAESVVVPGWETTGGFTALQYGVGPGFPSETSPGPLDRGQNLFSGGPSSASAAALQRLSLGAAAATIDRGDARFTLAGYLGGSADQGDNATFQVHFLDARNGLLAGATIGPVTPAERTNTTALLLRSAGGPVPAGARTAEFKLQMNRVSAAGNDGFADNLDFELTAFLEPRLTVVRSGNDVLLSWSTNTSSTFLLQSTTRFASTPSWSAVTEPASVVGQTWVVTNRPVLVRRFYRLFRR
jgi:uncharacterized repeat protein (TIGR01451 family)